MEYPRARIKIRSRVEGSHIVEQVFIGYEGQTLALAGELRFSVDRDVGLWQLFGAALLLANDHPGISNHLIVESEGGEGAVLALAAQERKYLLGRTFDGFEYIQCLKCDRKSYHPEDIRQKYCGNCHVFHEGVGGF